MRHEQTASDMCASQARYHYLRVQSSMCYEADIQGSQALLLRPRPRICVCVCVCVCVRVCVCHHSPVDVLSNSVLVCGPVVAVLAVPCCCCVPGYSCLARPKSPSLISFYTHTDSTCTHTQTCAHTHTHRCTSAYARTREAVGKTAGHRYLVCVCVCVCVTKPSPSSHRTR